MRGGLAGAAQTKCRHLLLALEIPIERCDIGSCVRLFWRCRISVVWAPLAGSFAIGSESTIVAEYGPDSDSACSGPSLQYVSLKHREFILDQRLPSTVLPDRTPG